MGHAHIEYWWLGSAIAAFAALLIIWINWGRPWLRRLELKRPFIAYFVDEYPTSKTIRAQTISVPANADVVVHINYEPQVHFEIHMILVSFLGHPDRRPQPYATMNGFVKIGQGKEESPDTNPDHYIDVNDGYHIQKTRQVTKGNCYTLGFRVRTRAPGRYKVRMEAMTEGGESKPRQPLELIVDEAHSDSKSER